jgi:hypothetical protein
MIWINVSQSEEVFFQSAVPILFMVHVSRNGFMMETQCVRYVGVIIDLTIVMKTLEVMEVMEVMKTLKVMKTLEVIMATTPMMWMMVAIVVNAASTAVDIDKCSELIRTLYL